jgi:hypothetical protein
MVWRRDRHRDDGVSVERVQLPTPFLIAVLSQANLTALGLASWALASLGVAARVTAVFAIMRTLLRCLASR